MRASCWLLSFLLLAGAPAAAGEKSGLTALHAAVSMLGEQQNAVYRQFLMVQELQRANDAALYASQFGATRDGTEVPDHFEAIAQRSALARRSTALLDEAHALYREYQALGMRKAVLQERILELTR